MRDDQLFLVLLEDDDQDASLLLDALRPLQGYMHVERCSTVADLARFTDDEVDFAVVDLRLHDSDGTDTIAAVKSHYPNTPFVVYSRMSTCPKEECMASGAIACIPKPGTMPDKDFVSTVLVSIIASAKATRDKARRRQQKLDEHYGKLIDLRHDLQHLKGTT